MHLHAKLVGERVDACVAIVPAIGAVGLEQPERETAASARKRKNTEKTFTQRAQRRRGHREEKKGEDRQQTESLENGMERLARRSIGYFTEDRGAAGAGCGGEDRRALVRGFVGERGKGQGFVGIVGNAE